MNTEQAKKIDTLTKYIKGQLSAKQAASNLGLSERSLYRKIAILKDGVNPFVHGNTGKVSKRKIDLQRRSLILKAIKDKYFDLPLIVAVRLLAKEEKIVVSKETVRRIILQD